MSSTALPELAGWESFYVITGSSSAGLIGLMFVVISLTAETRRTSTDTLNAFATPSVVHFGAVLLIAAMLSTPGQTPISLAICLSACGTAGLIYSARVVARTVRQNEYEPLWVDWLWYMVLPIASYIVLLAAAVLIRRSPALALYLVGGIDLALLYIGMHNAWDTATWIATHSQPESAPSGDPER